MPKPEKTDYPPFYAGYVGKVPETDLSNLLASQHEKTIALFSGLTETQANFSYAPGKWTLKEVLGHMIDAERVFAYRGLCMARGDQQSLPGMDQDLYLAQAHFNTRTLQSLVKEYDAVRQSTLHFVNHLTEEDFLKTGTANGGHLTVNAVVHIIAGHELHHIDIIKSRYLQP